MKFFDSENGGFWQSANEAKDLILRVKDDYDGAEPSGNSVATLALLKLGHITGRKDFNEAAGKTLSLFAHRLQNFPQAMPFMLHALDFSLQEPRRVVIADNCDSKNFQELLRAAHSVYQPSKIILGNSGAVEEFARSLPAKNEAAVYLCTGNSCRPPTSDLGTVEGNAALTPARGHARPAKLQLNRFAADVLPVPACRAAAGFFARRGAVLQVRVRRRTSVARPVPPAATLPPSAPAPAPMTRRFA